MTLTPQQLQQLCEYVDGTLDGASREAFERALAADATLRAELDAQRAIDGSLGRAFEYEAPAVQKKAPVAGAIKPGAMRWVGKPLWLSVAAAVLLGVLGVWFFAGKKDPLLVSPQAVYDRLQAVDFKPSWTCKDDAEFARFVKARLGEGVVVPTSTPGVQIVGWSYGDLHYGYPLSKNSMILITKVGEDHVLVLMDRAGTDRKLAVPEGSSLHLFKAKVGGLVLYEVSPRNEAAVLGAAKAAG